jgi:mannan endo-1,4-beta-mannosidase
MKLFCKILGVLTLISCTNKQLYKPSDSHATEETKALYKNMQRLVGAGILFGHHDDTAYGVEWRFRDDSSDVKSVTGSYPAVYGWDLSKIEHGSETDVNGLTFELQKKRVKEAYQRGGINTFCWHMDNPANGKTSWDTSLRTIAEIIPGGFRHATFIQYLDSAAKYLGNLKGNDGEPIPILFRPFHEFTGNWFWWGKNTSTPDEFKTLWRFTISYLRGKKNLHNLLVVYSAADFNTEAEFMQRYPGDEYVDFVGVDDYCHKNVPEFEKKLNLRLSLLDKISEKHHKLSCLAETGYQNIPSPDWWTKALLPVISKHKTSYMLTWRNANIEQFFTPYPDQISADDFQAFYDSGEVIFQDRLTPLAVYGKILR